MIQNAQQLSDVISDLKNPIDYNIGSFTEKVSKDDTDNLFTNIEDRLNKLYEKIRYLQDLHDFVLYYVQDTFKKKNDGFNKLLNDFEDCTTYYEDVTSITHNLPFNSNATVIKDRDGSIVTQACSVNGLIVNKYEIAEEANISAVDVISNEYYYRNYPLPLNRYKSFYVIEDPINGGITETLNIVFNNHFAANSMMFDLSNCAISSISLIRNDNELINVDKTNMITFNTENIKGLKLTLNCNNYKKQTVDTIYYKDIDTISFNKYINNIKDGIFNAENGGET